MKSLLDKIKQVYNSIVNPKVGAKLSAKHAPLTLTGSGTTHTSNTGFQNYYQTTYSTWNNDYWIKRLKRDLYMIQYKGTWTHEMDEAMFNSVVGMLQSKLEADHNMAKEIIFNSKMILRHRKVFANMFFKELGYGWNTLYTTGGITGSITTSSNTWSTTTPLQTITTVNPNYHTTVNPSYATYTVGTGTGIGTSNYTTTNGKTFTAKKAAK